MNVLANGYYMHLDDFVKSYQTFNLKIFAFRFEGSFAYEPGSYEFRSSSQHHTTRLINKPSVDYMKIIRVVHHEIYCLNVSIDNHLYGCLTSPFELIHFLSSGKGSQ